ncbi:hypothetical protein GALMADRAFT_1123884 [Galerina marginata CBS 339.88]|uniref:Uncharacterized protein n=1 Tax=Galerina marginata (strain CBS 339.88) TaxID=685588 RepID=A0A067TDA2_GALM3|nr:hypothetical protein GALMADRAFT_1123884 [Galerina marginata CBS 339.88]
MYNYRRRRHLRVLATCAGMNNIQLPRSTTACIPSLFWLSTNDFLVAARYLVLRAAARLWSSCHPFLCRPKSYELSRDRDQDAAGEVGGVGHGRLGLILCPYSNLNIFSSPSAFVLLCPQFAPVIARRRTIGPSSLVLPVSRVTPASTKLSSTSWPELA